jgi:N-acetyl-1-D-myo-inositol-2-amino-2-deoxy-alpha-D-glucopyranoside deacetylase
VTGGLLLVHAHPDDESISTGATMARYAAQGRGVTLVTCTRGEQGEIVPARLQHLGTGRALGDRRVSELGSAMLELGVSDHRFLGDYEDSGMIGTRENQNRRCFWRADVDTAVQRLLEVMREVRPQAVVTYNESGGYGHPDHIQAHRVAVGAFEAALGTGYAAERLYYVCLRHPGSKRDEVDAYNAAGRPGGFVDPPGLDDPYGDSTVTTVVDGSAYLVAKLAAIGAHETQLTVHAPFFALSNNVVHRAYGTERYHQARGLPGPRDELLG